MSPLKILFYKSCSFLPMQFLQKQSPVDTLLPYQHAVSDEALPHIQHLYPYKNIAQFKGDLDVLLKYFKPISADDLCRCIKENKPSPKNTFLLTFDDGFRESYDVIAPILEAKGVPAVFFINPAFIDNSSLFLRCKTSLLIHELVNTRNDTLVNVYRNYFNLPGAGIKALCDRLKSFKVNDSTLLDNLATATNYSFADFLRKQKPYLTTEQLLSLKQRGFAIGAHSMTHPYYEQISHSEQLEQTVHSCNYVKEKTGMTNQYFSFPYNDENITQDLLNDLNLAGIDLLFGLQNQKNEIHNKMMHRFNAERPLIKFDTQVKSILLLSILNKFSGNNDVRRN